MFSNIRSYLPAYLPSPSTELDANYGNAVDQLPDHSGLFAFDKFRRYGRSQPSKIYHYSALDGLNQHMIPCESFELPNLALGSSSHQTFGNVPYKPSTITREHRSRTEEELLAKFNIKFPELIEGMNNSHLVEKPRTPDIRIVSPACNQRPSESSKPKRICENYTKPKWRLQRRPSAQLLFFEFEAILSLSHFNQYQRYFLAQNSKKLSMHQNRCLKPFFNIAVDCSCDIDVRKKLPENKGSFNIRDRRRCYITISSKRAYNITKALKQFEKECPKMMEKAKFFSSFPIELSTWNNRQAIELPDSELRTEQMPEDVSKKESPTHDSLKNKGDTFDANANNSDQIKTRIENEVDVVQMSSKTLSKSSSKKCVIS